MLNTYRSRLQVLHGFQSERACANSACYCPAGILVLSSQNEKSVYCRANEEVGG
jgi:hypothetical protein